MNNYKKLSIADVCDAISKCADALIICHINPDADALGSALAMREIFSLMGVDAKVVSPSAVPKYLNFMTGGESFEIEAGDEDKHCLVMSVDVASPAQLGVFAAFSDKISMMIDHHASGTAFADNLIFPDAAACGEIIFKIYRQLRSEGKIPQSGKICRYLYAAISADCGSFKYSNTTPETLRIAADLMEEIRETEGMPADEISRLLHDTVSKTDMAVAAFVNSGISFHEEGSIATCIITADEMEQCGFDEADLGGAIDIPRKIEDVLVAAVLKERRAQRGVYKISTRSNCDIDVAAVCQKFDGGGHIRAAGGTVSAPTSEKALEKVLLELVPAVKKFKNSKK